MNDIAPELMKLAAEKLRGLGELEKRAEAIDVYWEQVDRGLERPPRNAVEFREKVAELSQMDLRVVREAMKLASTPSSPFASLEAGPTAGNSLLGSAESTFFAALM